MNSEKFVSTVENALNKNELAASFSSKEKDQLQQLDTTTFKSLKEQLVNDQSGELMKAFNEKFHVEEIIKSLTGTWEDVTGAGGKLSQIRNKLITEKKLKSGISERELVAIIQMSLKYSKRFVAFTDAINNAQDSDSNTYEQRHFRTKNIKVTGNLEDVFNLLKAKNQEIENRIFSSLDIGGKDFARLELASGAEVFNENFNEVEDAVNKFKDFELGGGIKFSDKVNNNGRIMLFNAIKKIQALKNKILRMTKDPKAAYKQLKTLQAQTWGLQNKVKAILGDMNGKHLFDAKKKKFPSGLARGDFQLFDRLDLGLNDLEGELSTLQREKIEDVKENELKAKQLSEGDLDKLKKEEEMFNLATDIVREYALKEGKNINIQRIEDMLADPALTPEQRADKMCERYGLKSSSELAFKDGIKKALFDMPNASLEERQTTILLAYRENVDSETGDAVDIIGDHLNDLISSAEWPESGFKKDMEAFNNMVENPSEEMMNKFIDIEKASGEEQKLQLFSDFCKSQGLDLKPNVMKIFFDDIMDKMDDAKESFKNQVILHKADIIDGLMKKATAEGQEEQDGQRQEMLAYLNRGEMPPQVAASTMIGIFASNGLKAVAADNVADIDQFSQGSDYKAKNMAMFSDMTGIGGGNLNFSDENKGSAEFWGGVALDFALSLAGAGALSLIKRLATARKVVSLISKLSKIAKKLQQSSKLVKKAVQVTTKGLDVIDNVVDTKKIGGRLGQTMEGLLGETLKQSIGNPTGMGYGNDGILPSYIAGEIISRSALGKIVGKLPNAIKGGRFTMRVIKPIITTAGTIAENTAAWQLGNKIGNTMSGDVDVDIDAGSNMIDSDIQKPPAIMFDNLAPQHGAQLAQNAENNGNNIAGTMEFEQPPEGKTWDEKMIAKVSEEFMKNTDGSGSYKVSYPTDDQPARITSVA